MPRRRPKSLSEDDLSLWAAVAKSARPLRASKDEAPPPAVPPTPDPPPPPPPDIAPFTLGSQARAAPPRHDLAPTLGHRLAAHPVRMDAKAFAKLKRGKLKPERKLDLHGMTLAEAHPALIRFVLAAHADGARLVLVVTGKGRDRADEPGPIPAPRGLLRHSVPGWLHAPPLRSVVLQVTDAHIRHGGSGAYYVYLRRPGR